MSRRTHALLLAAVLALAAFLRFDGLTFGMPRLWHPDERGAMTSVHACARGERRPERRYRHPPLFVKTACVARRLVRAFGDPPPRVIPEILAMRSVSAVAGTATVVFVDRLAVRLGGPVAGLGAALLFAVFPASVVTSRYGTPDSLLTMLIVAALLLQARMAEGGRRRDLVGSALVTTFAVATKYNAAFLAFSFVPAFVLGARRAGRSVFAPWPVAAVLASIVGATALAFSTAIAEGDLLAVLAGAAAEGRHLGSEGHFGFALGPAETGHAFHFQYSILPASGHLLLAAMVAGLPLLLRGPSVAGRLMIAFALPYYMVVESILKVPPSFERYALPLVPVYAVAAVLAAQALVSLPAAMAARGWVRGAGHGTIPGFHGLACAVLVGFLAWAPTSKSLAVVGRLEDDTRARMEAWLSQNLDIGVPHVEEGGKSPVPAREPVYVQWPSMPFYYPSAVRGARLVTLDDLPRPGPDGGSLVLASSLVYGRYLEFPGQDPARTAFYRRLFEEGTLLHEEDAGEARYMFQNPTLRLYRWTPPAEDRPRTRRGQRPPSS